MKCARCGDEDGKNISEGFYMISPIHYMPAIKQQCADICLCEKCYEKFEHFIMEGSL